MKLLSERGPAEVRALFLKTARILVPVQVLVWLICLSGGTKSFAATTVADLRCEHLVNPLGIECVVSGHPMLSWILKSDGRG